MTLLILVLVWLGGATTLSVAKPTNVKSDFEVGTLHLKYLPIHVQGECLQHFWGYRKTLAVLFELLSFSDLFSTLLIDVVNKLVTKQGVGFEERSASECIQ